MVTGNWEASTTIKGCAGANEFGVAGDNGCHWSGYRLTVRNKGSVWVEKEDKERNRIR